MNGKQNFDLQLKEVIDLVTLQEMQDKFADATGLAAVITDREGKPITAPSNFSRYCKLIRSSSIGLKRCIQCDALVGLAAAQSRKTSIHCCHGGLVDLAAPIIVNRIYVGSVLCGQVLLHSSEQYDYLKTIRQKDQDLGLDVNLLVEYFQEIEIVPEKRVWAAADLLSIMANYIIESGMATLTQKELHEKNIQLIKEMSARAELERTLKELELKALQSQVNPHFLFNALNSIIRLAMFEKADSTQEIAYSLAQLLRYSLRNIKQVVSITEEIDHVKNYLNIQRIRFGDRINFIINIIPEIMALRLPLMTLQPLVENSIVHGLEPKAEGGTLRIEGRRELDWVVIEIVDDGVGIPQEKVKVLLMRELQGTGQGHTTGIGLPNVYQRLLHCFNNQCQLHIESKEHQGTKITIRIPYS